MSTAYSRNPSFYDSEILASIERNGIDMTYRLFPQLDEDEIDDVVADYAEGTRYGDDD
jgi:hypothetical protein